MPQPPASHASIGEVLRAARAEQGLELSEIERRTKLRSRYLRALEEERWSDLPGAAYAKGFLRTYASELGLDAEALVDELRRRLESGGPASEGSYPLGEQVLEHRRRPGRDARGPGVVRWVAAALALAVIGAGAYALLGGDGASDGERRADRPGRQGGGERGGGGGREGGSTEGAAGPVQLSLRMRESVEVCLVAAGGEVLIDGQALAAGSRESYEARSFRLDLLSGGELRATVNGRRERLSSNEPARFAIDAAGVRERPLAGQECP